MPHTLTAGGASMRSALGFFSLLAFGVLASGVLTVVGSGSLQDFSGAGDALRIDFASLLIGLVLGIVLSALARVSWSELPSRCVRWLLDHERSFYRLAMVGVFLGILFFY